MPLRSVQSVSYTHLDVYKRQTLGSIGLNYVIFLGKWCLNGRFWRVNGGGFARGDNRFVASNSKWYLSKMNHSGVKTTVSVSYTHLDVYKRQIVTLISGLACSRSQLTVACPASWIAMARFSSSVVILVFFSRPVSYTHLIYRWC